MSGMEHVVPDLQQRVGIAFTARSPIERLIEWKEKRGWVHMPIYSDVSGDYTRHWVHPEDADVPAYNVFTRRDGRIRHFWGEEMTEADPDQDPRGAIERNPLWLVLTIPAHSGMNLVVVSLARRSMALAEGLLALIGLALFVGGMAAIGRL